MSVCLRVTNVWLFIDGYLPTDLRDEIQDKLSFFVPNFKHMTLYKQLQEKALRLGTEPEWDGRKTLARVMNGSLRCPTGLVSMVKEILIERKIPYTVDDQRAPTITQEGWTTVGFTLRDYQDREMFAKGLKAQRGIMWAATGSGKTKVMCAMIVAAKSFPAVFYVPSCDLLKQAYDVFKKHVRFNGQEVEIGRVGAGYCEIRPITIATVQSCQRALDGRFTKFDDESEDDDTAFTEAQRQAIRDMVHEAQFIFVDECQHTSADTIQCVMNNSYKARYRIGGSASPWRDDGLDLMIEACFGRRFCKIDASYLIKRGFLVKPHIIFNHFRQFLGKAANYSAHYTRFIVENEPRNRWIAERARFHIERGRPTIILVKWSKHAEKLKELLPEAEVLTSSGKLKKTPEKRKEILGLMRERKLMCIIGTSLLDEGIDIPSAGAGIFAGGGKSSTRALQRIGRIIRIDEADPDKQTAYIEEFFDHCRWMDHHAKMRRSIYETEPEFEILENRATMAL